MRRSNADIAITAAVAVISFVAVAVGAPVSLTTVLGIALVAAPGYLWGEVLLGFRVVVLERIAVATGLALAVPVVGGLALYAAGVPLHRLAWAGLLGSVALAGDAVLLIRGRPTPPEPLRRSRGSKHVSAWHAAAFGAAVVIAAGAVAFAREGAAMQRYPGFSQLWLSPRHGDNRTADLGVSNHQGELIRYRLVLLRNGHVSGTWNLALSDGQTWQRTVTFTARYSIAADLYRLPDLTHPYRYVATDGDRGT
jgi:hypothetical protein